MGLASKMQSQGALRTKVHVSEIRRNKLNRLHISDTKVAALAWSMQQTGQLENATVYEDDLQDGKKYTLIGGETRWRAMCLLFDKGAVNGEFYVTIIPRPATVFEEKRLIRDDNIQRKKTDEDMYFDILDAEEEYEWLCENGKAPTGKKRDYVGKLIGMSGRNVDNIKKKFDGINPLTGYPKPVEQDKKKTKENPHLKDLGLKVEKLYQCRVKVSDKSISFTCKDTDELNQLLETLGIQKQLDELNY